MLDAYLVLGDIAQAPDRTDTADGRPWTRESAIRRIARLACADESEFGDDDARKVAEQAVLAQRSLLASRLVRALSGRPRLPTQVIVAGEGEFLVDRLIHDHLPSAEVVSITEKLGPAVARCAPAYAVMKLGLSDLA